MGNAFEFGKKFGQAGYTDEVDAGDEVSEGEIFARKINGGETGVLGGFDDVDDAADGFGLATKGEFANEQFVFNLSGTKSAGKDEDSDGNGEIKMGTIFGEFGGSEVDGNFAVGEGEAGVSDGGTDTLTSLSDGFIRHADEIEAGEAAVHVALNGDEAAGVTVGNGGINFGDLGGHSFTIQYLRQDLQRISGLNGNKVRL